MIKKSIRYFLLAALCAVVCSGFTSDGDERNEDLFYPDVSTLIKMMSFSKEQWQSYMAENFPKYKKAKGRPGFYTYLTAKEEHYEISFNKTDIGILCYPRTQEFEKCFDDLDDELKEYPSGGYGPYTDFSVKQGNEKYSFTTIKLDEGIGVTIRKEK